MVKLTVLYGHPSDVDGFEAYYANSHLPLLAKIPGLGRTERARVIGAPGGGQPAYHRIFEFWFASPAQLEATLATAEMQAAVADLDQFARDNVTILVAEVED